MISTHPPTTLQALDADMIPIQGGTFWMGSDLDLSWGEAPKHKVQVSDFELSRFPICQGLWHSVMGSHPARFKHPLLPVESASWEKCQMFIRRLNDISGQFFRMPTEAEWEYAALGGLNNNQTFTYAGSNDMAEIGWSVKNAFNTTHTGKEKLPNRLGIVGMSGNVYEWCQDWHDLAFFQNCLDNGKVTNPEGPKTGSNRVIHGGSWYGSVRGLRVSYRSSEHPEYGILDIGFRIVRD
ncbi:formylglycine-generating enzyme family protein [Pontibacter sp. G13]|uniref:formylglycine-generating enzyme family protein n=1 Tax=Pontibacter sp. G13 TaxID=3074898 RepID=UPI0028896A26|nr:formylglycine-generating enzyme family protein [Pontibacter sp. G13]WNJ19625.1 formylglycine-generating enzyme family protein [Pontibacter sp. G13]